MRASHTNFLTANMKNAVIPFVTENADSFGITKVTQSSIKAWIDNASDIQVENLAKDCGFTADSMPKTSAPTLTGAAMENVEVETANGANASVPCYMLSVKKWDVSKSKSQSGKVTYTPVLKLDLNGKTLSVHHELFRNDDVRASIVVGDVVPVRADSVTIINGTGSNGVAYSTFRGAILEASISAIGQARAQLVEREIALAGMSKEAQQLVTGSSAEQEAKAFFAKFGK